MSRIRTTLRTSWWAALAALLLVGPARADEAARTWIVVPAPAFRHVVEPLIRHRFEQGYHVAQVDVEQGTTAAHLAELIHAAARSAGADCAVLLVGAVGRIPGAAPAKGDPPADTVVPAFAGTVGRMEGRPTDNPYGSLDGDRIPEIPVGRLPARSVEEATTMVAKTLGFEATPAPRPWRRRLSLIVGNPGGSSPLEKRLADHEVPVAVAVERPFGTEPEGAAALPADGRARDAAIRLRWKRANDRTVLRVRTTASHGRFAVDLPLPKDLPAKGVVVRAGVRGDDADGAVRVPLAR